MSLWLFSMLLLLLSFPLKGVVVIIDDVVVVVVVFVVAVVVAAVVVFTAILTQLLYQGKVKGWRMCQQEARMRNLRQNDQK